MITIRRRRISYRRGTLTSHSKALHQVPPESQTDGAYAFRLDRAEGGFRVSAKGGPASDRQVFAPPTAVPTGTKVGCHAFQRVEKPALFTAPHRGAIQVCIPHGTLKRAATNLDPLRGRRSK